MQKRKTMRQRYQKVNNDISQRKYDSALIVCVFVKVQFCFRKLSFKKV